MSLEAVKCCCIKIVFMLLQQFMCRLVNAERNNPHVYTAYISLMLFIALCGEPKQIFVNFTFMIPKGIYSMRLTSNYIRNRVIAGGNKCS